MTTRSTADPAATSCGAAAASTTSSAGDGNDVLHALARDNQVDTLDCGPGLHDVAWLRAGESDTTVNCEKVITVSTGSDG